MHNYQGVIDAEPSRKPHCRLRRNLAGIQKPLAVCVFTTEAELRQNRHTAPFPIFTDPREAIRALARNRDWQPQARPPFADVRPTGCDRDRVRSRWLNILSAKALGTRASLPIC